MSDISKINTTVNLPKFSPLSMAGPISNEYYEKATQINKITENQVDIENMNFYATPVSDPKNIAIQSLNLSAFDKKVFDYQKEIEKELNDYNRMLIPIEKEMKSLEENLALINEAKNNYETYKQDGEGRISEIITNYLTYCSDEKLKELGLTKEGLQELDYLELLEICKEKDSSIKEIYQTIEQYKSDILDSKIRELTGFSTYDAYNETITRLQNDQAVLLSAIRVTKEDKNSAKYRFLLDEESYKNYSYQESDLDKLSPLEKVRNAKSQNLSLVYGNYDDLKNLIQASKSNPDLSKMYNYLYETEGLESANQYVENMKSTINQICGMQQAEVFLNQLKNEENIVDAITNHFKTTGKGLTDGVDSFAQGISSWFTSSDIYTIHDYETMYILQELQTNENYNGLLDNNYEISQSIGNMLPSIALSMILTPSVGTVSMGVSAGGNSYHSALAEGYSKDKAALYGVINGVSEATLEKYLGAIPGLSDVSVTGLKTFAQACVREGIEEGTQEYLDALVRSGLFEEDFDMEEVSKNASKSAIYGAITGGIMNTPSLAISGVNKVMNSKTIEEINVASLNQDSNNTFSFDKTLDESFKHKFYDKLLFSNNPEFSQLGDNTQAVEKLYNTLDTVYKNGDEISKNIVSSFLDTRKVIQVFPAKLESSYMLAVGALQIHPNTDNNILLHEIGHYYFHQLLNQVPTNFDTIMANAKSHALHLKNVDFQFNDKKFENGRYLHLLEEICSSENKYNYDLALISDILSGLHLGATPNGPNGPLVLPFMHNSKYYMKRDMEVKLENIDYAKVFDEQFANFFSLYMNNQTEKIEVLRLFLGEEWYQTMMNTLTDISNICTEKNSNVTNNSYQLSTDGLEKTLKEIVDDWNAMGVVDLEIGKQIENLFNNENSLSGIHMTSDLSVANQILTDGLKLTGHISSGVSNDNIDLGLNISFTKQDEFLAIPKFFRNIKSSSYYKNYTGNKIGYAIVVQIPNDVDVTNLTYLKNGVTYLKPEYVKAQIEVNDGNIVKSQNTIFKVDNLEANQKLK